MIDDGAVAPAVDASMMASAQTPHVRPAADACDWKAWRDARLLSCNNGASPSGARSKRDAPS